MSWRRASLLTGMISLGLAASAAVAQFQPRSPRGQTGLPPPSEATDEPSFPSAQDLADALQRALAAVREAEQAAKQGAPAAQKIREANFYIQEALRFDSYNRKANYLAGRLNVLTGRSRDAFSQIQEYVRSPEGSVDWEAFKTLGDLHFQGTYYVQAEAKYRRAAELAPSEPSIYLGWSKCRLKQGKRPQAISLAQQAIQLDPTASESYEALAEALVEGYQLVEAKVAIRTAIDRSRTELREKPASVVLLQKLRRQYQTLETVLDGLVRQDPSAGPLYLELADAALANAEVYRRMLLHELHRRMRQGILATQPKTPPELIERFAELSAAVMKHDKAVEVLEEYLETNPLDETARRAVDTLKAGMQAQASAPRQP